MNKLPIIKCKITLLTEEQGGRTWTPIALKSLKGDSYRPHFVVGDTSQREAIIDENNNLLEEYLGISFSSSPNIIIQGEEFEAKIKLIYYPNADYSSLKPGATFTIREGDKVVGFGTVI